MMTVYLPVLLSAVLGEGFQMVADAGEPKVLENHEVVTFVVRLSVPSLNCSHTSPPLTG